MDSDRLDIARHWILKHPPPGGWKPSRLTRTLFVERFGGVYEHSPWVAAAAYDTGLTNGADTAEGLAKALAAAAAKATAEDKRALIGAHPDLAGRLALAGTLTADSTSEQSSAGLDRLAPEELRQFAALNHAYRERFGFPFIMAVKGKSKADILAAFQRRLAEDADDETRTALAEIDRIAAPRLKDILAWRSERARHSRPHPVVQRRSGDWRPVRLFADRRRRRSDRRRKDRGRRARPRRPLPAPQRAHRVDDHAGCLIMPGFIDAHVHYPQTQVIGSYGAQLLDWLHNYTFVEEQKFVDPAPLRHAVARFLPRRIVPLGTTTAMVYCTVHPQSVEAFFAAAEERGARMIAGKAMMDRDAPQALRDHRGGGYDESKALIERWRGRGRLGYAITPRFAVTSTQAQLEAAGALAARDFQTAYVQTHARREQGRDRPRGGAVSGREELSRRLRAGGPDPAPVGVRPLHPFAGQRKSPRLPPAVRSPRSA